MIYETLGAIYTTRGFSSGADTQLSRPMRDWPCIIERTILILAAGSAPASTAINWFIWVVPVIVGLAVINGVLNPLWRRLGW